VTDEVPVIRARGLTKRYGARTAVDRLDLEVPRGSIFGLLGQNGAGKSTTIRMLLGLTPPTAGEVLLFGRPLASERLALLPRVGCLVEGPAFYPFLSGRRNLELLGALTAPVPPGRVQQVLDRVGLGARGEDLFKGYSTGMRQRLGIAAALLHDPELIILDEPVNGLDPPAVLLVRNLIKSLAKDEGKTLLVSSHLLHEVEVTCDRVAIVEAGRVIAQGKTVELVRHGEGWLDLETNDAAAATEVAKATPGVASVEPREGGLRLRLAEPVAAEVARRLVGAGLELQALVPRRRTLEELYHELAAGKGAGVAGAGVPPPSPTEEDEDEEEAAAAAKARSA
jgi:ABC-2 type transport system ATP-binding protein